MSLKSGLAAQIGYAAESTPGTAVAVTRFVPLVSESIALEKERLESEGIIAGRRVLTSDQWNGGNDTVSGSIQHEIYNRGLGVLFNQMFGAVTSNEDPYDGVWTHTFSPGDLSGKSLTVQVGRPGVNGTVAAFNYAGCKVSSWEIALSAGEIATLGLDIVGMSEAMGTPSLASATYPAGMRPLKFNHGSVLIGGVSTPVKSITISGDNGLADDRRFIGSTGIAEPLEADLRTYEGSMELEWDTSSPHYQAYLDGDEVAVVLNLSAGNDSVEVIMNVRFEGETPSVGGREILSHNVPFKCVADAGDDSAITVVLTNTDATL